MKTLIKMMVGLSLLSPLLPAYALQDLSDQQLAATTGQDGLTVKINPKTNGVAGVLGVSKVYYTQRDTSALTSGSAVATMNSNSGIVFCTVANCSAKSSNGIVLTSDADGQAGTGAKVMWFLGLTMPTDATTIRLDIKSLNLVAGTLSDATRNKRVTYGTEQGVINFSNGITLTTTAPLQLMAGLGNSNAAMGGLIKLTQANFSKIDFGTMTLVNSSDAVGTSTPAKGQMSLGATITGLNLTGSTLNLNATDGLVFNKAGTTDKFNVDLTNITLGNAGAATTGIFDGTQVAPIGNMGIQGIQVSNLKVTVKGF